MHSSPLAVAVALAVALATLAALPMLARFATDLVAGLENRVAPWFVGLVVAVALAGVWSKIYLDAVQLHYWPALRGFLVEILFT